MKQVVVNFRNLRRVLIAGALAAAATHAGASDGARAIAGKSKLDVNGTWHAKVEGHGSPQDVVFVLRQDKDRLTGTMSTNGAPPVEIHSGKVYRNTIRFSFVTGMETTSFVASVEGDTMTLKAQIDGARGYPQRAQLRRMDGSSRAAALPVCLSVSGGSDGLVSTNSGAVSIGDSVMVSGCVTAGPATGYQGTGGMVAGMPIAQIRRITATR
jgi:hypothetical protein